MFGVFCFCFFLFLFLFFVCFLLLFFFCCFLFVCLFVFVCFLLLLFFLLLQLTTNLSCLTPQGSTVILKIPLDQIGYLTDDYQPANYKRSPSTKMKSSYPSKSSMTPSELPNGAVAGGTDGEWEDDRVEEGFQQDEYRGEQDDGGYSCKLSSVTCEVLKQIVII